MRLALTLLLVATIGCSSSGEDEPLLLEILAPAQGSTHERNRLVDGALVAEIAISVDLIGNADSLEAFVGAQSLGTLTENELSALVDAAGSVTITVRALDGGDVVAEAAVDVQIVEPVLSCAEWLDLWELSWIDGPAQPGVVTPVTVTVPINGISYRYLGDASPRSTFYMDCELARSLAEAASLLRARDIVEVSDIGVYNYRCIGGVGTPPDCPNGISQHAYATALDMAGFTDSAGTFYSVNDDWVIDPDAEEVCEAPTEPGADTFLHETICELKAAGIWNIILTPNYNADHRDHFHVDLTPGADYIGKPAHH